MNTKTFMLLLVAIVVLSGSVGVAFAGGVAVGKGQEEADASGSPQLPTNQTQPLPGELTQEQLDQLRQRFQGQRGSDGGGAGFGGRGGLTGTIDQIQEKTITLNTSQGPLQALLGADTMIQIFTEGSVADLESGLRVTVVGQRGEDGTVAATSIIVIPVGVEGFPNRGSLPGISQ